MSTVHSVVEKFQGILSQKIDSCASLSSGKPTVGRPGVINCLFLHHLAQDLKLLIEFLFEVGLLKAAVCKKCGSGMKQKLKKSYSDGSAYVCRKMVGGNQCNTELSIRNNSWFSKSKLKLFEILLISYEILRGTKTGRIAEEYGFASTTLADWRQFINEVILNYIEENSEKVGGDGVVVEIDESKFGKRKYHKGHRVEGQWVFGGVERGSGRVFLVAVHDRCEETLLSVIKEWIKPGTSVYSDCWKSYDCLTDEGYEHLKVNHSLTFVDPDTGCHTNTIESTWRHVKATLPTYNRKADFKFYLAMYMFRKSCLAADVDCFNKFMEIVAGVNWEDFKICL